MYVQEEKLMGVDDKVGATLSYRLHGWLSLDSFKPSTGVERYHV